MFKSARLKLVTADSVLRLFPSFPSFSTNIIPLLASPRFAVYESKERKAGLVGCGFRDERSGELKDIMSDAEALGNFSRSAALAVFSGDTSSAVDALERGASSSSDDSSSELFVLVSMCVAGFDLESKIWRKGCERILGRKKLPVYLRIALQFLYAINRGGGGGGKTEEGKEEPKKEEEDGGEETTPTKEPTTKDPTKETSNLQLLDDILTNSSVSLSDRTGLALLYLSYNDLTKFLLMAVEKCVSTGRLQGIIITGLNGVGVNILQAYVDRT